MMTPTEVARQLDIPGLELVLLPFWEQAIAAFPGTEWLDKQVRQIDAYGAAYHLPTDAIPTLLAMAKRMKHDPALCEMGWYLHWRQFVEPNLGSIDSIPDLEKHLGAEESGAFYLLLSLSFATALGKYHQTLGYPAEVTQQTLQQIGCFESYHRRGRGTPGMVANQFGWLRNYLTDPYVRLGRFEYQLSKAGPSIFAWRHRTRPAIMALAAGGRRFDAEGLETENQDGWTSSLMHSKDAVSGYPLSPAGRALPVQITLPREEWEPFLAPGVSVLALHIPDGGKMTLENCRDSFRHAWDFFSRFHQDRPPVAIVCTTWFLDARLRRLMPESNAARLQSALYCHPSLTGTDGGLWFVYLDAVSKPIAERPRETSIQRALNDFLLTGARWNGGAMFLPFDDAKDLRQNRYADWIHTLPAPLQQALSGTTQDEGSIDFK